MPQRLSEALLDSCRCDPRAPLVGDPGRDLGLHKTAGAAQFAQLKHHLDQQQQLLWANRRHAVLLWLQGSDCSGKDGAIRHVFRGLNPQGVEVSNFQVPSSLERQEHFLQRYRRRLPPPGSIGIFNRCPYEGVVGDCRDGFIDANQAAGRLQEISDFEDQLRAQGIVLLKVYLQISPQEQHKRLRKRLLNPHKHWKLSSADLEAHRQFAPLQAQWAKVLGASHRPEAPWYLLPADHKWLRNLLLASLLNREFAALGQQWPTPPLPFDLAQLQHLWAHTPPD
jgi:polyphosphate kinase 2 (PPK2 family)